MFKLIGKEKIGEIVGGCQEWFEIPDRIAQAQMKQDARDMVKWLGICSQRAGYIIVPDSVLEALKKLAE